MLLVLAQFHGEHSKGKEILQGEVEEDEICWVLPIPTPRVSLLRDLQGTKAREWGRLSPTCTTGNARLGANRNIFYINRTFDGKSNTLWEQRLERCLSGNSARPKAEEQAQNLRNKVPG